MQLYGISCTWSWMYRKLSTSIKNCWLNGLFDSQLDIIEYTKRILFWELIIWGLLFRVETVLNWLLVSLSLCADMSIHFWSLTIYIHGLIPYTAGDMDYYPVKLTTLNPDTTGLGNLDCMVLCTQKLDLHAIQLWGCNTRNIRSCQVSVPCWLPRARV